MTRDAGRRARKVDSRPAPPYFYKQKYPPHDGKKGYSHAPLLS